MRSAGIFVIFCVAMGAAAGNEEWTRAQAPMESPFYRGVLKEMFPEYFAEVEMKENEINGGCLN